MKTFLEIAPLYEYEHNGRVWMIEVPRMTGGPCVLKPNGEPYDRVPAGGWDAIDACMAERDKERFRV